MFYFVHISNPLVSGTLSSLEKYTYKYYMNDFCHVYFLCSFKVEGFLIFLAKKLWCLAALSTCRFLSYLAVNSANSTTSPKPWPSNLFRNWINIPSWAICTNSLSRMLTCTSGKNPMWCGQMWAFGCGFSQQVGSQHVCKTFWCGFPLKPHQDFNI